MSCNHDLNEFLMVFLMFFMVSALVHDVGVLKY